MMRIVVVLAVTLGLAGWPAVGQVGQHYDRRVDLSTQPMYAPFGQMPQDYRDAPSLYGSGNVRYGRAFTGNRNFLEDRYFDSPMTRFYRDTTSAYDVQGGGRQYGGAQPYYQRGSIASRGDVWSGGDVPYGATMQRADPFGLTVAPPVTFADPVAPPRGMYWGAGAGQPFAYVPPSGINGLMGSGPEAGVGYWSPRSPEANLRLIESLMAAEAEGLDVIDRGPYGTPMPMRWRAVPADAGVEETAALPNPWILLPAEIREDLERRAVDPERRVLVPEGMGDDLWDDAVAPPWLREQMSGRSIRDRLIESMREQDVLDGNGAGEGAILDPQSAIPYGGPARAADMGDRALRVGRINLQLGLYRQAIQQFERAAMLDMRVREEARRLEGHARLLSRSDRLAALMLSESMVRTPEYYGRAFRLTAILDDAAVWERALEYTLGMMEQLPEVPMYGFLHGYVLHGLGRHGEAEPYLRKVADEGSGFAAAAEVLLRTE